MTFLVKKDIDIALIQEPWILDFNKKQINVNFCSNYRSEDLRVVKLENKNGQNGGVRSAYMGRTTGHHQHHNSENCVQYIIQEWQHRDRMI